MTEIIRDLTGYPMSRDYRRLWELVKKQSVVCVVDYRGGAQASPDEPVLDPPIRDVCQSVVHTGSQFGVLDIGARGISYLFCLPEDSLEDFERQCKAVNLEWIVPGIEAVDEIRLKVKRRGVELASEGGEFAAGGFEELSEIGRWIEREYLPAREEKSAEPDSPPAG